MGLCVTKAAKPLFHVDLIKHTMMDDVLPCSNTSFTKVRYVGFQRDLHVIEQTNISGYELLKPLNQMSAFYSTVSSQHKCIALKST